MGALDGATRAQALALKLYGVPTSEVARITGITSQTVWRIYDRAVERGLDPNAPLPQRILDSHVADSRRTGRPKKQKEPKEAVVAQVQEGSTADPQ